MPILKARPKPAAKPPRFPFRNAGELLVHLGGIPAWRVRLDPPPGTATTRDLVRLHGQAGKWYELVDRTLVEKPMGSPESHVAIELVFRIRLFLETHELGFLYGPDALIKILPQLVREPDISFVSWVRRPERTVPLEPISTLIPDLAVEVLSPDNTRAEMDRKRGEYFRAGVRLVWEIDPATRTAVVYAAPDAGTPVAEAGTLDGGDVLPGFRVPLAKLFEQLAKPAPKKGRKKK